MLCAVAALCALLASAADGSTGGTGSIEGEIAAQGGAPLAGVWACAYLAQGEEFEENCDFTGGDGLYVINGLKAGEYKVEFWSEATEPSYVGEFYDDKSFWEEADEVEVEEGVVKGGIDAELAEGATIKGEIRAASLGGPVKSAVACASLPTGEPQGCARIREDGSYTLPGLPAGDYKVVFVPDTNLYNLLNQFYDHKAEPAEADLLAVAAGETKFGVDADLEAGAEIHGTVYSAATGAPVPRVWACALFMEEAEGGWWPLECAHASTSGNYEFSALPTDSYKVVFSPELKEFFGEDFEEQEDDGYFTQYFDNKPTLAAADLLALTAPEVRTGVDAHLQPEARVSLPSPLSLAPAIAAPKSRHKAAVRCRPGLRKKKVSGKRRCVKIHKHHRRGHSKSA